ncbi:MAG: TonB-dependent receptor [Pedobacter sp.]|nr:TonB-dependent receptor [Pedobacter sp.]MDQ8054567.1 TonB-dependent receptor [Pedobacter sp.]
MKYILLPIVAILITTSLWAQQQWKAQVLDQETKKPLPQVTVSLSGLSITGITDEQGNVKLDNIPSGNQRLVFKLIGYAEKEISLAFPYPQQEAYQVFLTPENEELETVTIASTRSSRSIENIPTRVEFIAGEELEEKANMKPGDIRMVLSESTGIQTQQTSAISANAAIRIQGLDGRYTQLLKDGFPLYAGAASGLGLLQIAPLDLKQIELIKGSASTLYGGGAIAGLVNLISKTPKQERELNFHLDATDALGLSVNGYYAKRNDRIGTTLFAAYQRNSAYDPAGIDLSAIPQSTKITFNPKLFLYPTAQTTLTIGIDGTFEDRTGGDIHYIKGDADALHSYFEQNKTKRVSSQLSAIHQLDNRRRLLFKNSFSYFERELQSPGYIFDGTQYASFTEVNYTDQTEDREWTIGLNAYSDRFREKQAATSFLRSYTQVTWGAFIQNLWKIKDWFHLETGLRSDRVRDYGFVFLPRVSVLLKLNKQFNSRLGGGLGYKTPTIFTEESERLQYRNVMPIDPENNRLEKSYGANWDVNYSTALFNTISLTANQLFFYTRLTNPLLLAPMGTSYAFVNAAGNLSSKGMETNVRLGYGDFKLFMGYTYTDAHLHVNGVRKENPLTAKHRVNAVLMYEVEEKWKMGLEAYTFSKQLLNDGTFGRNYLITGFMAEKLWKRFSIYINFENFLDARQTQYEQIYTGSISNPQFRDVYAPLDGFVVNGGVKLRL